MTVLKDKTTIVAPNGCTVTLYCGDCMDILPSIGHVDAVITDPPYGAGINTDNSRFSGGNIASVAKRGNGPGTARGRAILNDDKPFDPTPFLGIGRVMVVWGWNHFAHKLPAGTLLVWVKRNEAAYGTFLSDAEVAWVSRGRGVYLRKDLSNNAIARKRLHPTQKPVGIMEWCIERAKVASGEVVLDPFMGSGTTGVAALRRGCNFIGVELDAEYFERARTRITEYVNAESRNVQANPQV